MPVPPHQTPIDFSAALPFADFAQACLYDPEWGYYSSGKVTFGRDAHFWTYPQRMRPLFGWMVAEAARTLFAALIESGRVPPEAPLHLLELGGGNADLAGDTLDYIVAHAAEAPWTGIAGRVRYVLGEHASELRVRQRARLAEHIAAGRAEVRAVDASDLRWEGPFYGMLVANELVDAFPCEVLRISAAEEVARLHVVARDAAGAQISREALWERLRQPSQAVDTAPRLALCPRPLAAGWQAADGRDGPVPAALQSYLARLQPLVTDLARCDLLPVDLCWAAATPRFVRGVAALLSGPERCGAALLIDYGGSSRHVLDPRAMNKHLRVYGPDGDLAHSDAVLHQPGHYDITWDVDFSDLAALARAHGLAVPFYGHQQVLERDPIVLWSKAAQRLLLAGRHAEGLEGMQALIEAHELVMRFREAGGFRLMALSAPDFPFPAEIFGPSDAFDGLGLATVAAAATPELLGAALQAAGLPEDLAAHLKPCGDPVADLSDRRSYHLRAQVLAVLALRGWLVAQL